MKLMSWGEIQSTVQSCLETERSVWAKSQQLDQIISEKVREWFGHEAHELGFDTGGKLGSVVQLECAFARLQEDFNTFRSEQRGCAEKLLEEEREARKKMMEAEASSRIRGLNELSNTVLRHINMSVQREREERDACCK